LEEGPQADERRLRMHDHVRWDTFNIGSRPPLGFEARAELRAFEKIDDPRRDTAGNEDAAAGAKRQRGITRNAAQKRAKQIERGSAGRAGAIERRLGDVGGVAFGDINIPETACSQET
jgi:hypothetical protein